MGDVALFSRLKMTVTGWLAKLTDEGTGKLPKEGEADVSNAFLALWKESLNWRKGALSERINADSSSTIMDPVTYFRACRKLEEGHHWEVWGRRNLAPGSEWKHELVDDEIGNQIRVRKSHLMGAWHQVAIFPNIHHLTTILDQERAATRWGETLTLGVHQGLTEGTAVFMSVLDRDAHPDGIARELVLDNASVFPTPYCTSIERIDGCWYVCVATMEPRRFVEAEYPKLRNKLADLDRQRANEILTEPDSRSYVYNYTGMIDKLVFYVDDDTLESIPAADEEIQQEHAAVHMGQPIYVLRDQNHKKHVEEHYNWIDEINSSNLPIEMLTPEDLEFTDALTQYMLEHIALHITEAEKKLKLDGIPIGKRRKYPFGRKVVLVGGEVAEDIPSEHEFDWRKLFHAFVTEKLPGHWYGRGAAEVLWTTNKTLDTMICRTADVSLAVGIPKPWLNVNDKSLLQDDDLNNDPQSPNYYATTPPTFPQGQAPRENLEIYQAMKANAQRQQGVTDVSYGASPSASASGDLVETLMKQNAAIITGEANQQLNAVVESIIETRLMMWKQYYVEPRFYYIDGQWQAVTLADVLSQYEVVTAEGKVEQRDIPMFQVRAKPGSNIANQWELDLAFAIQLYGLKKPDGMPLIPPEAIYDIIQQRYPQWSREGKYYQLSEATKVGMQVMSQEAARKKEDVRTLKGVRQQLKKQGLRSLMQPEEPTNGQPIGGSNGN